VSVAAVRIVGCDEEERKDEMRSIHSAKGKIVRTARLTAASLLPVITLLAIASFSPGSAAAGVIPGQYIVVLKDGVDGKAVASEHARMLGASIFARYQHALNGYAARLPAAAIAALQADNRVLFVSEDREVFADTVCTPQDFSPSVQCIPADIDRIDGDLSSTKSGNGRGSVNINVAVLDTGIDVDHPDLAVAGGVNCSNDKTFDDPIGHGTNVAGIIGALDNSIGVVGVAPGARLWAVRVLNQHGSGTSSSVLCGIDWATSTRSDSDPSNDISVANMSLGGPGQDDGNCGKTNKDAVHLGICDSVAAGIVYVAAAGNDATDIQNAFPAGYDEVLTATAIADFDGKPGGLLTNASPCRSGQGQIDDTVTSFSNFGTLPSDQAHTIAAPGACIFSTYLVGVVGPSGTSGYEFISGTSQASPHVAGTVALCIASGACGGMSPAQIIQKIVSDAADYNIAHPKYGFVGDPLRPITDKYYGYLIRAGSY
jgi:subtilisin